MRQQEFVMSTPPVVQGADLTSNVHLEARVEAKNDMSRCCPRNIFCCSKEVKEREQVVRKLSDSQMSKLSESFAKEHKKHCSAKKH